MPRGDAFRPSKIAFGLVAFVDLLGFSDRVREVETTDQMRAIERDVRRVQSWLDHDPKDTDIKVAQKYLAKSVLAFSDCVVVSVPFHSEMADLQGDFDVLMNEVSNLAYAQGRCATHDIFVRGGADFGMWYRNKDVMISPAMVNSYHLERAACVPMIALSAALYDHLSSHAHRQFYAKEIDPLALVRRFENLPNGTSQWLLDYVPHCLESVDGDLTAEEALAYRSAGPGEKDSLRNQAFRRDAIGWARRHAQAIGEAHGKAPDQGVRDKYEWLASYHNNAVGRFFGDPPPETLVGPFAIAD